MLVPENESKCVSKSNYRKKIWDLLKNYNLLNNSVKARGIPHFKKAAQTAKRLSELREFKNAKVININLDSCQRHVGWLALKSKKDLLVRMPESKGGLYSHVVSSEIKNIKFTNAMSKNWLQTHGKCIDVHTKIKVDIVVLGMICVSRNGHGIGKDGGLADLEFATLMEMGIVNNETIVVTTIEDLQLVDGLEVDLFQKYDVPVDIIVTPTRAIIVNEKLRKPIGIFWNLLTHKYVNTQKILQQLKLMDEGDGKNVELEKKRRYNIKRRRFRRRRSKKQKNSNHYHDTWKIC